MSDSYVNVVTVIGTVVDDPEIYPTRTGKPKVSFRIAIPRSSELPKKKPANYDFYTVVCQGERFVPLVETVAKGRQVVVIGWVQSRDVEIDGERRVVHEIGARQVLPILDSGLVAALDSVVSALIRSLPSEEMAVARESLSNGQLPNNVLKLLPSDGQLHPEIIRALQRALEGRNNDHKHRD